MGRTRTSEAGPLGVKRGGRRDRGGHNQAQKTGFDGLAEAPWRKTPSIFKQPVTLVRTTSRDTSRTPDLKLPVTKSRERLEQRRQIFWAKSLEGFRAMIPLNLPDRLKRIDTEERLHTEQHLILPPKVEPTVSALSEEAVAATLCSALQLYGNEISIVGQQSTRKQIDSNPLVAINFSQPLVQIPTIAEQDIKDQERKVLDARKRLQELRKSFACR